MVALFESAVAQLEGLVTLLDRPIVRLEPTVTRAERLAPVHERRLERVLLLGSLLSARASVERRLERVLLLGSLLSARASVERRLERVLLLSSLLGARASELGRRLGRLVGRLGLGLSLRLSRRQLRTQGDPCRTPRHFRRKHLVPMHAERLLGLTELSGQLRLVSFEHRRCALGSPQVSL